MVSMNGSSTVAAVAAAQKADRADVNGSMAEFRAPWLAYLIITNYKHQIREVRLY